MDDEPAVRELVMRALQEVWYEVVAVRDGKAGLVIAKSAGVPYDLVITNSYMPTMSGEQLIEHLRGLFPTPRFCTWTTCAGPSAPKPRRFQPYTSHSA